MCQTQRPRAISVLSLAHDSVVLVAVVYPFYDTLAQSDDLVDTTHIYDHMQGIWHDVHVMGCVFRDHFSTI